MKKTIKINNKIIDINIWEIQKDFSSDNKYINIHFTNQDNNTDHSTLHIWFSHLFILTSTQKFNFKEIAQQEINIIIETFWENLFKIKNYFVFFESKWKFYNKIFAPFDKDNITKTP